MPPDSSFASLWPCPCSPEHPLLIERRLGVHVGDTHALITSPLVFLTCHTKVVVIIIIIVQIMVLIMNSCGALIVY